MPFRAHTQQIKPATQKQVNHHQQTSLLCIATTPLAEVLEIIYIDAKLLYNKIFVQKLTKQNKELSLQIKEYKNKLKHHSANQPETTGSIMKRVWNNKEDEYWDTL